MEQKNEFIKHTISYIKGYLKYYVIDCYNNDSVVKLFLKILTKDYEQPCTISFICPSSNYFEAVMPGQSKNIKTDTSYNLKQHKLKFYIYDKKLLKNPPSENEILIFYPFEQFKSKEVVKLCEGIKSANKIICLGNKLEKPDKKYGAFLPDFFTFKPDDSYTYYNGMMNKINNIK